MMNLMMMEVVMVVLMTMTLRVWAIKAAMMKILAAVVVVMVEVMDKKETMAAAIVGKMSKVKAEATKKVEIVTNREG